MARLSWGLCFPGQQCHAIAGVESSLRVTHCRLILRSLPEHNYAVLRYLMGFLHEVSVTSCLPGEGRPALRLDLGGALDSSPCTDGSCLPQVQSHSQVYSL